MRFSGVADASSALAAATVSTYALVAVQPWRCSPDEGVRGSTKQPGLHGRTNAFAATWDRRASAGIRGFRLRLQSQYIPAGRRSVILESHRAFFQISPRSS